MEESLFNLIKAAILDQKSSIQVLDYFSTAEREEEYIAIGISPASFLAPGVPFLTAALVVQAGCNRQEVSLPAEKVRQNLAIVRDILAVNRKGTLLGASFSFDGIIPDGNPGTIGVGENDRFIVGEITYKIFATKQ